jgi:uncharacterized protein
MTDLTASENPVISLRFDDLANLLLPLGTLNSPSELHGLLCGKLAGGARLTEISWLLAAVEFLDFTQAPDESVRAALSALFHSTREQLRGSFELKMMLPDDDYGLAERVSALSQWCHGFLTGFGSVEVSGTREINEDVEDTLHDFASIVQIQADGDEDEPSAEADYMEVTEYVRMAASGLFLEFGAEAAEADSEPAPELPPTLH